ncbi:hypothetical protein FNF28_03359 [Cafeteria roenbergensis]|uniref:Borealin N-terminal domain-containing protein n=1 Tax=Cafeteria roenbergensis TaxID=33653 RepID=A0A5A8DJZ9_CAFRO|nr:hypothetical protein FNF28_03359 [Cafeteria roenbergensis]
MASRSKRRPAQGDGVRPVSEDPARSELVCKLSELNVEVDRRCDKVVADSEAAASELRSAFSMQMAKLPKRIRAMTMREFIEQCGGNVMQAPETEEGGVIIDLATADGRALDLSKPDVAATLSGADKEAALARLLALQSQVASVLSKLNA